MFNPNDFDELKDIEIENLNTNFNDLIDKLPSLSSQKLSDIIICDRYLGLNKDLVFSCMNELSSRREAGEVFDFESYIEQTLKELPVLNFSVADLKSAITQAFSLKQ